MPIHTSIITVRKMRKSKGDGSFCYLYHISAGLLKQLHNEVKQGIKITTETFMNDELAGAIRVQCRADLSEAGVTEEKTERLLKESPHFVVTENLPSYVNGNFQLKTVKPEVGQSESKEVYIYRHSEDKMMMMTIGKPNSPAPVQYIYDEHQSISSDTAYYGVSF